MINFHLKVPKILLISRKTQPSILKILKYYLRDSACYRSKCWSPLREQEPHNHKTTSFFSYSLVNTTLFCQSFFFFLFCSRLQCVFVFVLLGYSLVIPWDLSTKFYHLKQRMDTIQKLVHSVTRVLLHEFNLMIITYSLYCGDFLSLYYYLSCHLLQKTISFCSWGEGTYIAFDILKPSNRTPRSAKYHPLPLQESSF